MTHSTAHSGASFLQKRGGGTSWRLGSAWKGSGRRQLLACKHRCIPQIPQPSTGEGQVTPPAGEGTSSLSTEPLCVHVLGPAQQFLSMGKRHGERQTWGKKLGAPRPQSMGQARGRVRRPHSLEGAAAPSCGRNSTRQVPGAPLKDRDVTSPAQAVGTATCQAPGPAHPTKQTKACAGPQGCSVRAATGSWVAASGQVSSHSRAGPRRRSASHLSCHGRCFTEPKAGSGRRSTPVFTSSLLN